MPGAAVVRAVLDDDASARHDDVDVPVDLEPLGAADSYGSDRLFAAFELASETDAALDDLLAQLEAAGQPVVRIPVARREDIGQEFVRWEVATAFAGAVIGIDPFDQPDVEDAKVATRKLVDAYEEKGALEPEQPIAETADFAFFAAGFGLTAAGTAVFAGLRFPAVFPADFRAAARFAARTASRAQTAISSGLS